MVRDLIALENTSKVWIYPAARELSYDELDLVREDLFHFLDEWTSHNNALMTYGNVFHRRFLALFVDETLSHASGCSIDKSVHFVESIRAKHGIDFFDRLSIQYMIEDEIFNVDKATFVEMYNNGQLNAESLIFDHTVQTKGDFLTGWIKPLSNSWQKKYVKK